MAAILIFLCQRVVSSGRITSQSASQTLTLFQLWSRKCTTLFLWIHLGTVLCTLKTPRIVTGLFLPLRSRVLPSDLIQILIFGSGMALSLSLKHRQAAPPAPATTLLTLPLSLRRETCLLLRPWLHHFLPGISMCSSQTGAHSDRLSYPLPLLKPVSPLLPLLLMALKKSVWSASRLCPSLTWVLST